MATIVPTITAENSHQYREQVERVSDFALHLHIDLMDGQFTPNTSVEVEKIWLPDDIICDIHAMYLNPVEILETVKTLKPRLLVVPAESQCDFRVLAEDLSRLNIKFGVALLADTPVQQTKDVIEFADHVLIFSGNLGHQGGSTADLTLLDKAVQIKSINPNAEIGWDGGVNQQNVKQIADAGVDVINVGGAIHFSKNPADSFSDLQQAVA